MSDNIKVGICRFTTTYGLDADGQPHLTEQWDNLSDPGERVPMILRAGLLTMAQQSLTADACDMIPDDWHTGDED